jgi:hypothetical protein
MTKLRWDLLLWPKFWEHLKTYLSQCRGVAHTPLHYLVREHDDISQDRHNMALYDLVDNYLIATTILRGDNSKINNTRMYNKLKPLVVEGTCWAFIKKFECIKNG